MGLDCSAYSRVKRGPTGLDEEERYSDKYTVPWVNPAWPEKARGIESGEPYSYSDSYGFRAGSYGGYSRWREELAALAGYSTDDAWEGRVEEGAPFAELINFSDCEGVLNTATCIKLHADFVEWREAARAKMDNYSFGKYEEWTTAFALAKDDGFLKFH